MATTVGVAVYFSAQETGISRAHIVTNGPSLAWESSDRWRMVRHRPSQQKRAHVLKNVDTFGSQRWQLKILV